jgi:DNA-binding LacI/PurR family transcriptional regulator
MSLPTGSRGEERAPLPRSGPLYRRIKERIRVDLLAARGEGTVERLPPERELEARYGVSRPTIRKALDELTGEGLLHRSPGSGSFILPRPPDPRALSQNGTRRLGYVAPIPGHELTQRSLRGIEQAARRRDYRVIFGNAGSCVADEQAAVHDLLAAGICGLVVSPVTRRREEAGDDYLCREELSVPVVLIDTARPEHRHPKVLFDNWRAAYEVTRWLFEQGHRRIGLLSYYEQWLHPTLATRLRGYQDAVRDLGVGPDPFLVRRIDPHRRRQNVHEFLAEWLASPAPPTAVMAAEDHSAMDAVEQLLALGIRVPQEIQVVGWDNLDVARRFRPHFPTTNPDFVRMGELACDLLLRAVEQDDRTPWAYLLEVPLLTQRGGRRAPLPARELAAHRGG